MSLPVSARLKRLAPSATVAISRLAGEMRAAGEDVIALSAGEPDFDTPEFIATAAIEAIRQGHTRYTAVDGIPELKQAICTSFKRDYGLDFATDQVIASVGGKQLCFNACLSVLQEGDEGIAVTPYWVSYPDMIRLADATAVTVQTRVENNFKLQPKELAAALSSKTRLLFLNSPGNPTGNVYNAAELRALGDVLGDYPSVVIVSDEIYAPICWAAGGAPSFAAVCPELKDRTLTVNGVSKAYAMTGWRLGFGGGPAELVSSLRKLQGQSTTNPCSISQHAAVAALNADQGFVAEMSATYQRRHDYVQQRIREIAGLNLNPAEGAFYAFIDARDLIKQSGLKDDAELCTGLLESVGLALVPGSAFGTAGFIRLSYACADSSLSEALDRLEKFCAQRM